MTAELSTEQKAELYDYIASRCKEMKLQLAFGGSEWVYNDSRDPVRLASQINRCQEYEREADEEEG